MERPVIALGSFRATRRAKVLVMEALDRNRLSYGPFTQRFETQFANLHDCRFGIMSNSGTSALVIALAAMKEMHNWKDGDEVIVPAITFVATSNAVVHNNMQPIFVDVDPIHYELDPQLIEDKIGPKTKAIIPVHLFGQPCDMDAINEIATRHGLKIIEDSCETMFARYKGRSVGNMGDIGCFSTYMAHLLVTGVGGLNTTNSPEYAIKLRSFLNHGRDSIYLNMDDDDDKDPDELRMIIDRRFSFVSLGHSFRITEMEAALGLAQIEDWQSMIRRRQDNALFLTRAFTAFNDRLQLPTIRSDSDHSFMMYPIVLRNHPKQEFVNYLEQHGVETRDMMPLINQPAYRRIFDLHDDAFPVAKWINESGFYIGCHQDLRESDLDYVVELFERYWRNQGLRMREGAALILSTHESQTTLENIFEVLPLEMFDEVIAVDNGSSDGTVDLLEKNGIAVIQPNGKDFFSYVLSNGLGFKCENIVFYFADGRQDPRDIARLLLTLERGNDIVIASRFIQGGSRYDKNRLVPYRSAGNRFFSLMADMLFYGNFSDTLSQFRAVKRRRLEETQMDEQGLAGVFQMSIQAMRKGWKVAEIPTIEQISPLPGERRKVLSSILPLTRVLIKEWFRCRKSSRDGQFC